MDIFFLQYQSFHSFPLFPFVLMNFKGTDPLNLFLICFFLEAYLLALSCFLSWAIYSGSVTASCFLATFFSVC